MVTSDKYRDIAKELNTFAENTINVLRPQRLYDSLTEVEKAIKALKAAFKKRLLDGERIPGLMLDHREGSEFIEDIEACKNICKTLMEPEEFKSCVKLDVAKLKKIVCDKMVKKTGCTKKVAYAKFYENIPIKRGAPVLAIKSTEKKI